MAILEPFVPREYLALQINYCKQQLAILPEVNMGFHTVRGERKIIFKYDNHKIGARARRALEQQIQMCTLSVFPAPQDPKKTIYQFN